MLIIVWAILCCGAGIQASRAAVYYVDATNGLDVASGLSPSTAWKTIAKVNQKTFAPGDQILFNRGCTWRELLTVPSSGTPGHPITFGAYGSGANPIITGSNLITAGWSKDSANIWKSTVTTQPNIVYFDGTRGTLVAAKANITAEFNWFWASNVLYVWSPANTDPGTYYTNPGIEAGARNRALTTNNQTYITIDGLTLRDGNATNDSTLNGGYAIVTGFTIQNCMVERGVSTGIHLGGSSTATSATISNCTIRNNGGWGILIGYPLTTGGNINNNVVYGNGWMSVTDNIEHSGIEGYFSNLNIFNNTIYNTAPNGCKNSGSTGNYCHGMYSGISTVVGNVYNNLVYSNAYGSGIRIKGTVNVYNNTVYNNATNGLDCGQNGTTNIVCKFYYNLIYSNGTNDGSGIHEGNMGTGTISLTINNNVVYQNAGTSNAEVLISDDLASLTIENNIMWTTSTRRTLSIQASAESGTVVIDYNLHWRADGNPSIRWLSNYPSWSQWKNTYGFDAHGVNANPAFTNAGAAIFTLQSGSPAINAGVNVGLSVDLAGRQVPYSAAPDIGAYEWVPPALSAPSNLVIKP
jgi:hypothetical protein